MRDSIHNNKLTGDYLIAHLDILSYLQSCNISATNKFSIEVDDDMTDMLLSAQENETPISDIVGNDIKIFCEDIVQSYYSKRDKALDILKKVNFDLYFLLLIVLLVQVFEGSINLSIVITFSLTWLLYKYILNFFYKKLNLRFKGLKNKTKCILLIFFASVICLFPIELTIIRYCDLLLNGYNVAIVCLLLILVVHIVCKKLDKNIRWYSCFM